MIAVYDKLIYFNEASKYTILRMRTDDPSVPEEARSQYTFRDRMLRFTAVGYGLPQTDSVKLEIEGDWKEGKKVRPAAPCRALARACAADNGRTSELSFVRSAQRHRRKHG